MKRQQEEMEAKMKRQQKKIKRQQQKMKIQQEKMTRKQEEMKAEMQRRNLAAEGECKFKAAELETALSKTKVQDDDDSPSDSHSCNSKLACFGFKQKPFALQDSNHYVFEQKTFCNMRKGTPISIIDKMSCLL